MSFGRRNRERHPARRLRIAVDALPTHTKEAMLEGISRNRIIVGAYVDPSSGGICPMLAAHRNGGRTSVATFARAWDDYTDASRPRRATKREVATLKSLLEASLARSLDTEPLPMSELAAQIRSERERLSCNGARGHITAEATPAESPAIAATETPPDPEFKVLRKPRRGVGAKASWNWLGNSSQGEPPKDLLAAAEEHLSGAPRSR